MRDHIITDGFQVGQRILLGSLYSSYRHGKNLGEARNLTLATISELDENSFIAVDEQGERHRYMTGYLQVVPADKSKSPSIVWSAPLPKGTDEQIKTYCRSLIEGSTSNALIWVTDVSEKGIMGQMVARKEITNDTMEALGYPGNDLPYTFTVKGNAAFYEPSNKLLLSSETGKPTFTMKQPEEPEKPLAVGELIVCTLYRCKFKDGNFTLKLVEPRRLGKFSSPDAVAEFLPEPAPHNHGYFRSGQYDGISNLWTRMHEDDLAWAASQPDKALIVVHHPQGDTSQTACGVMAHTGIVCHVIEDVQDYVESIIETGPGLWVLDDLTMWSDRSYEGEYDAGIEGNWRPATLEDLDYFGFDLASADTEICEHIDDIEVTADGLTQTYMTMAEAEHAETKTPAARA